MDKAEKGKKRKKVAKVQKVESETEANNNTADVPRPARKKPKTSHNLSPAMMSPIPKIRRVITRALARKLAAAGEPEDLSLSLSKIKESGPTRRGVRKPKAKRASESHSGASTDSEVAVVPSKQKPKNKKKVSRRKVTRRSASPSEIQEQEPDEPEIQIMSVEDFVPAAEAPSGKKETTVTQTPPPVLKSKTEKDKPKKKKKVEQEPRISVPGILKPSGSGLVVTEAKKSKEKETESHVRKKPEPEPIDTSTPAISQPKKVKTDSSFEASKVVLTLDDEMAKEIPGQSLAHGSSKPGMKVMFTEPQPEFAAVMEPKQGPAQFQSKPKTSMSASTQPESGRDAPVLFQIPGPSNSTPVAASKPVMLDKASRPKHTSPAHPQSPSLMRKSPLDTLHEDPNQEEDEEEFFEAEGGELTFDLDKTYVIQSHAEEADQSIQILDDIPPSPLDNYNITLLHEYDENMKHREGKQISKWAQSKDFVNEQLFRTQPNLMKMLYGRRSENPIFPPVDSRKKLFPGALAPRPVPH